MRVKQKRVGVPSKSGPESTMRTVNFLPTEWACNSDFSTTDDLYALNSDGR